VGFRTNIDLVTTQVACKSGANGGEGGNGEPGEKGSPGAAVGACKGGNGGEGGGGSGGGGGAGGISVAVVRVGGRLTRDPSSSLSVELGGVGVKGGLGGPGPVIALAGSGPAGPPTTANAEELELAP